MLCPECANENPEGSVTCSRCGAFLNTGQDVREAPRQAPPAGSSHQQTWSPPAGAAGAPPSAQQPPWSPSPAQYTRPAYSGSIPNYLVQSILVMLCCFMPLGIVALVFAAQVDSKVAAGDIKTAQEYSKLAKTFTTIGFWIGLVTYGIGFGAWLLIVILAAASHH